MAFSNTPVQYTTGVAHQSTADTEFSHRPSQHQPRGTIAGFDFVNDFEEWKDTTEEDIPKL